MASVRDFANEVLYIKELDSRNDKKDRIYGLTETENWMEKISILSGQRFDNIGIGKRRAMKAASGAFDLKNREIKEAVEEAGTVTEAIKDEIDTSDYKPVSDRIDELYNDVTALESISGSEQMTRLSQLLTNYTVPWLVMYTVLHDMKIGATHNTICMAAAEPRGYSKDQIRQGRALIPNTVDFVDAVIDGEDITSPSVGEPFAPMKAKSKDPPDDLSDWLGQVKLDGYRCIIHVNKGKVRAFSSSMKEQTGVLPELEEINWPLGEYIFDAEVLADDGEYVTTKERLQRDPDSELPHTMNFWVFDAVVVDGHDVSQEPFEQRLGYVFEKLPADERVIPVHAFEDIHQARSEAVEQGYEGLILKHRDHTVEFGQRSSNWLKDKITNETVDLRVAGFEQGSGKNAGVLGAIQLETEDGFEIGNVGTGFTDRQRRQIWNNRDEWQGAIVEISFDVSEGYEDGLRFPAFEGRREDKLQADTKERLDNIAGN